MVEFNNILRVIDSVMRSTWGQLSKLMAIVAVIGIIYVGYQIMFKGLVVYDSTKLVEVSDETVAEVQVATDKLLAYDNIAGVSVYLYQPDNLPKKNLQLLTCSVKPDCKVVTKHKVFTDVGVVKPLDMSIYSRLQYSELVPIDGTGRTFVDYMVRYEDDISSVSIYGLYRYATPAGSVVIVFKDNNSTPAEIIEIYNTIRYIDSLLYRE